MINERRVKEMFQMAVYDQKKTRTDEQMSQYYMWDYIGKELLKSFVCGTIGYILMVALWVMGDLEAVTSFINSMNYGGTVTKIVLLYVGFIILYLLVTALVYMVRYVGGRKKLRAYANHLRRVRKMYRREERLKRS
ncbi:MAG: hypothetical protein LUI02_05500 [Clostridiales bacterium]|nr:hypothetical protein [Clostridiales bacterium]